MIVSDLPRFADRFGRKTSFYVAWLWLVVVSDASREDGEGAESRITKRADVFRVALSSIRPRARLYG